VKHKRWVDFGRFGNGAYAGLFVAQACEEAAGRLQDAFLGSTSTRTSAQRCRV
jgi:hypothetical protein